MKPNLNTAILLVILVSVWFIHLRPARPTQQGQYKISDIDYDALAKQHGAIDLSAGMVAKSDPWLVGRFQKYEDGLLFDTESGRVCIPNARHVLEESVFVVGVQAKETMTKYRKGVLPGCAELTLLNLEGAREVFRKQFMGDGIPAPPPGYTLDPPDQWKVVSDQAKMPKLPPGLTLDKPASKKIPLPPGATLVDEPIKR